MNHSTLQVRFIRQEDENKALTRIRLAKDLFRLDCPPTSKLDVEPTLQLAIMERL